MAGGRTGRDKGVSPAFPSLLHFCVEASWGVSEMSYSVGIDLGATTCAAAIRRGDVVEPSALGETTVTMPAVALPRADGTTIVGEAADRHSPYEPTLVARMVAARLGRPEPILVDGVPCDPLGLTGALVGATIDRVAAAEGGPPGQVVLAYPLRPGDAAEAVLGEAAGRIVGPSLTMVPAPVAAVAKLAHDHPLAPDTIVAVLDVGGSTVDVTLVRRRDAAFDLVGDPASLTELGGVDLDAVVLSLVESAIGDITSTVSNQDPAAMAALRRVRASCRDAKERLSTDDAAVVEVALPHARGRVEITREALERAVEAPLAAAVDLVATVVEDAGMALADVGLVLLTGGSARIPCLAPLVRSRTGLEVVADDAPELTVALGAALFADVAGGDAAPPGSLVGPAGTDPTPAAAVAPASRPFAALPLAGTADTGKIPVTTGADPAPFGEAEMWSPDDAWELEPATPFDPGDRWTDTRTSVFEPAPPTPPAGADDQTTWNDRADDEFRRLRTSDTDPFGARPGALSSRIRHLDDHDEDDDEGRGGTFDVRLVIAGVVAAVTVVLVAGYVLLAGAGGSEEPAIAVADASPTTERAATSAPATTGTTEPPATTEATTTTAESTTTTRPRPRPTSPTTQPPVFEPTPTVPTTAPPTPPSTRPTPPPQTTTTSNPTTTTTQCPESPPNPPPGCSP
jgi:hypothetical protein